MVPFLVEVTGRVYETPANTGKWRRRGVEAQETAVTAEPPR
jgi:hypothetical protein